MTRRSQRGRKRKEPSNAYVHSRNRNKKEVTEDYVELIDNLIKSKGEARAVDLSKALGVSHVTVSKTVNRLIEAGFLRSEPYRSIFLTEKGSKLATQSRNRHRIVMDFLLALGVPARNAGIDAEGIEHHASPATLKAMQVFLKARK